MTDKIDEKYINTDTEELNNICDEFKDEDESLTQNLILTAFKLCKSFFQLLLKNDLRTIKKLLDKQYY